MAGCSHFKCSIAVGTVNISRNEPGRYIKCSLKIQFNFEGAKYLLQEMKSIENVHLQTVRVRHSVWLERHIRKIDIVYFCVILANEKI